MRTVPRRILIVRPSAFGDVCRTVPLLWSLRKTFPKAVIDWVVEDRWAAAISELPVLDGVVQFPKRELRSWWRHPPTTLKTLQWFWRLRRGRYDLVIDAQGLARSALMSWMTRAKVRIAQRSGREFSWLAANRLVKPTRGAHVVDAMLQLVASAGAIPIADMRLVAPASGIEWWRNESARREIVGPYIVLAMTNGWQGKRWLDVRWVEVMRSIADDLSKCGIQDVVWIGAPGEEPQVVDALTDISAITGMRSHNIVGCSTVAGTMAVIANSSLLLALDSAPVHVAVGFGVPFVALYGATQPSTDGPYQGQAWCAHGGRGEEIGRHDYRDARKGGAMMERITTDEVVALVRKRLQGRAAP